MKIDGKDWKLVPVDATGHMLVASHGALEEAIQDRINEPIMGNVWKATINYAPQPDIEALVEGVAWMLLGSLKEMRFKGTGDHWHTEMQYAARAVLRHLFGEQQKTPGC